MKNSAVRLNCVIQLFLIIFIVFFGTIAFALAEDSSVQYSVDFSSLNFQEVSDTATVIADIYGGTWTFDGVLDISDLESHKCVEKIASYEIFYNSNSIMKVDLHEIESESGTNSDSGKIKSSNIAASTNGYYSVDFGLTIDGTQCEAFITGLTNSTESGRSIADVQANIVKNAISNKTYTKTDKIFDFIDTEKEVSSTESNLCWAASASNVLHFTGWASKAIKDRTNHDVNNNEVAMADEDDIFDIFCTAFNNVGGNSDKGMAWFFNGFYGNSYVKSGSHAYTYGTFKGFLPNYSAYQVIKNMGSTCNDMGKTLDLLKEGNGVAMSVGWYLDESLWSAGYTTRESGHAITLWGYVIDPSKSKSDPLRYKKLIFSDSDSDKYQNDDRKDAVDRLAMTTLSYETHYIDSTNPVMMWKTCGYESYDSSTKSYMNGLINGFYVLYKYDDSITKESSGTKDLFNAGNLICKYSIAAENSAEVNSSNYEACCRTEFEYDDQISIYYGVFNESEVNYSYNQPQIINHLTLYKYSQDSQSYIKIKSADMYTNITNLYNYYYRRNNYDFGTLEPGDYRVTIELNSTKNVVEAYYSDNISTIDFTVCTKNHKTAVKKDSAVNFSFIAENEGDYVAAGFSDKGQMIDLFYFRNASAVSINTCTFNDAADMTMVKLYPISTFFEPAAESIEPVYVKEE